MGLTIDEAETVSSMEWNYKSGMGGHTKEHCSSLALAPKAIAAPSRANVSLRMSLNSEISPRCDETVYKVIVCAGEFTNEIVRFYADYVCLPNYFGKLCDKFCDQKAPEHICDEFGNPKCRSDYFWDTKTSSCRLDLCSRMPDYCLNEGTCVTNPDRNADHPYCLCRPGFIGRRCETKQPETTTLVQETTAVTTVTQRHTNRPPGSPDGEHYQRESRVPHLEVGPTNHSKLIRNAHKHSPVKDPRKYSAVEKLAYEEEQERKRTEFKWGPTVSELEGGHRVRQLTGDDE
ncbi:EGF-like domain protein, partial [Opisthorchis viverrini]